MLDPKVSQKLLLDVPEMKAFVAFIAQEMAELNRLDNIEASLAEEIALEVKARQRAFAVLGEILQPLINSTVPTLPFDNKEYVV